jgi:serine/threonine protein kinase
LLLTHGKRENIATSALASGEVVGLRGAGALGRVKDVETEEGHKFVVKVIHFHNPDVKAQYKGSWFIRLVLKIKGVFAELRRVFWVEAAVLLGDSRRQGLHDAFEIKESNIFKRFLLWLGLFVPKRYIVMPELQGAPLQIDANWDLGIELAMSNGAPQLIFRREYNVPVPFSLQGDIGPRLECVLQLAKAYATLHAQGWAHLDIKGHNVMYCVTEESANVFTPFDFGAAVRIGSRIGKGDVHGTPLYMAPELQNAAFWAAVIPAKDFKSGRQLGGLQALARRHGVIDRPVITGKEDVYSLGRFFVLELKLNQLGHAGLNDLIQEMTQRDPGKRPTMAEVARRLPAIINNLTEAEKASMQTAADDALRSRPVSFMSSLWTHLSSPQRDRVHAATPPVTRVVEAVDPPVTTPRSRVSMPF